MKSMTKEEIIIELKAIIKPEEEYFIERPFQVLCKR